MGSPLHCYETQPPQWRSIFFQVFAPLFQKLTWSRVRTSHHINTYS